MLVAAQSNWEGDQNPPQLQGQITRIPYQPYPGGKFTSVPVVRIAYFVMDYLTSLRQRLTLMMIIYGLGLKFISLASWAALAAE